MAFHIHSVGPWDGTGPCVAATFLVQGQDVPGRGQSPWHPTCASVWLAANVPETAASSQHSTVAMSQEDTSSRLPP